MTSTIEYKIIIKKEIHNISVFLDIIIKVEKSYIPYKTSTSLSVSSLVSNLQKLSETEGTMNGNLKNNALYNFLSE